MDNEFIDGFIIALESYQIALEAPTDITDEVDDEMDDITGSSSSKGDNSGGIDTNTDDILAGGDPTSDEEDSEEDMDEIEDEESDDIEESDDEALGDEDSEDMGEEEQHVSDDDKQKLKNLHTNFLALRDVVDTSFDGISNMNIENISPENTEQLSNIKSLLSQTKDTIYKILIKGFNTDDYITLQRKYISLKNVYEIIIKMTDNYFNTIKHTQHDK